MAKDPKWKNLFTYAVVNNDADAVRHAIKAGLPINGYHFGSDTSTPLLFAIHNWDLSGSAVLDVLLAAGADVNARMQGGTEDGETALIQAVKEGWPDLVLKLLKAGADPQQTTETGNALYYAPMCAKSPKNKSPKQVGVDPEEVVRVLLAAGIKPDTVALDWATFFGKVGIAKILLAAGADPNGTGIGGGTPLQSAVQENWPELVSLLLEANADPNRRFPDGHSDYPGMTPHEVAVKRRLKKISAILEASRSSRKRK